MPDYKAMEREYLSLPHGRQRAQAIQKIYREADRYSDWEEALSYRYEYIRETLFHVDSLDMYIVFPEYMAIYDEHPELNISPHSLMWAFKWVLGNCDKYYQISREDHERYLEEFKQRCIKYNYSLRTYYECMRDYYVFFDHNMARRMYQKFDLLGRDSLSDCRACERSAECSFLLDLDMPDVALRRAQPIFDGTMTCVEIPHYTYDVFLEYYIRKLDYENAHHYERLAYRCACDDDTMLNIITDCLLYCAIWEQERGLEHLQKHFAQYLSERQPKSRMQFARAAYVLFKSLAIKREGDSIRLSLPSDFELYNADGVYSLTALRDYFLDIAKDLAQKFAARDGHDYRLRWLEFALNVQPLNVPEKKDEEVQTEE